MSVNPTIYLKKWIQIPLRRLIKKLAHSDLVQSLVWGRNETQSLVPLDIFTDSKGNAFQRLKGWRGGIVPRYARALELQPNPPQVKTKEIMGARNAVIAMENFFQINGY
jgi:hypothetical protein